MDFDAAARIATDSPLTSVARGYSGEAAIPESSHLESTSSPPRRQGRFVVDLWAWVVRGELGTAWDFHRSVLSAIVNRRRRQPLCGPKGIAVTLPSKAPSPDAKVVRCFGRLGSLAPPLEPKRDTSRSVLAWPLRHRPLPNDAGCVVSHREIRARISGRARTRPGRIRPSFHGKTAPFETEPSTPAIHA